MKGKIYAICVIIAFFGGIVATFLVAPNTWDSIATVISFAVSMVLVPTVHELGHVFFASINRLRVVYVKFFCFRLYERNGKLRFGLASPMRSEETRVVPKCGGEMKKRATAYALGGLIFSGVFLLLLLVPAILLTCLGVSAFYIWGGVPYAAYLLLLNVLPTEYASGKTDMLVWLEIAKDRTEGKAFLTAMEIQGRLYAGETFSEIPEETYDTYGLREDEPLFAVLWDLKYHYYLEKKDLEKAADALNRIIVSSEYLTDEGVDSVRIESAYMFLLQGNASELKGLLESDEKLLRSDDYRVKRLLATYAHACGEKKRTKALVSQAEELLQSEKSVGVRKHEMLLLDRIKK